MRQMGQVGLGKRSSTLIPTSCISQHRAHPNIVLIPTSCSSQHRAHPNIVLSQAFARMPRHIVQSVEPALQRSGVNYDDESTWGDEPGAVIRSPGGGNHPIPLSSPVRIACNHHPSTFEASL